MTARVVIERVARQPRTTKAQRREAKHAKLRHRASVRRTLRRDPMGVNDWARLLRFRSEGLASDGTGPHARVSVRE